VAERARGRGSCQQLEDLPERGCAQALAGLAQRAGARARRRERPEPRAHPVPDLPVAQFGEQRGGQQQVDHHPRRQQPHPRLRPSGALEHVIDHLERHDPGQLTDMPGRENPGRYPDRARYDSLFQQRSPRGEDVLE
jgi:hypothetical protein